MTYRASVDSGGELIVENEGEQTRITLSSGGGAQKQRQGTGFTTGAWTKPPALFKAKGGVVLEIRTNRGDFHFQISGGSIRSLREAPPLKDALPLKKSKSSGQESSESLPPMKPLEPMAPMQGMSPMEMSMGSMRMSMGGSDTPTPREKSTAKGASRFCIRCGHAAARSDKFCAACGRRLE